MSEPIKFPPGSKVWFAPYGKELLGRDSDGTPMTADDDGVEPMKVLGHVAENDGNEVRVNTADWDEIPPYEPRSREEA